MRNDSDVNDRRALLNNLQHILVFHPDNIYSVDFQNLMISQEAIARSRRVFNKAGNFAIFKVESDMPDRVLVQSDCPLEWSKIE